MRCCGFPLASGLLLLFLQLRDPAVALRNHAAALLQLLSVLRYLLVETLQRQPCGLTLARKLLDEHIVL